MTCWSEEQKKKHNRDIKNRSQRLHRALKKKAVEEAKLQTEKLKPDPTAEMSDNEDSEDNENSSAESTTSCNQPSEAKLCPEEAKLKNQLETAQTRISELEGEKESLKAKNDTLYEENESLKEQMRMIRAMSEPAFEGGNPE